VNIISEKPLLAERLKEKLEKHMQPYRERFKNAAREVVPDEPFYFPINSFDIAPESAYITLSGDGKPLKPWALKSHWARYGLVCMPDKGEPLPITVSTSVPDGTYDIYVLLISQSAMPDSPQSLGFKYRFSEEDSFSLPDRIEPVIKGQDSSIFYLDLGEIEVSEKEISIQFLFHSPDKNPYEIRHIKFVPDKCKNKTIEYDSEEEIKEKIDRLKSLGYL
jgi:hypothetical protein